MDPKSENILTVDLTVDIDPTILLGLEFEKMKFVSQLDVESVLSEEDIKSIETNNTPQDLQTSDSNSESDAEEPTPGTKLERNKDINGNEETLSDNNINQLLYELELSDSDNEENDEEPSPRLRARGPDRNRLTKNHNRSNYLQSNNKYDRSQINPRNLQFLSGSSYVQPNNCSLENNQSSAFNTNEVFYNVISSEPVLTSYCQFYEDSTANSVGSPESGYESSLAASPPPILSSNQQLESIPQLDEDQKIVNYIAEVCALIDHAVPRQPINDGDCEKKIINELVEYLKDSELVEKSNMVASSNENSDIVPLATSGIADFEDVNNFSINLPPILKNEGMPKKIGYKLKDEAKKNLRQFLSKEKFWASEEIIFKRLIKDMEEKRPIKVIYVIDEEDKLTSLHHAVLKQNKEEIYCLVEIQKIYDLDLSDLNIRDKDKKTALDHAIEQHMHPAVIDYLIENTACQSVIL